LIMVWESVRRPYMKLKKLTLISLSRTDRKTYNKAKHSDSFFVSASPPLQSCACWRR
jgi:hypothetical protein